MLEISKNTNIVVQAEIDKQVSTAKNYPRNTDQSIEKAIKIATMDEETAAACFYALARKDRDGNSNEIKGPSIRLAEIMAWCWQNLHAASRIIGNDGKKITAEGVAWDLENNVRMSSEVERSILTRSGATYSHDMQVVTGNAACAIALRNAIVKAIPKVFIDRVYTAAVKFAVGDQKTLHTRLTNVLRRFNSLGIPKEKIFSFFNKQKLEDFTLQDLENLIGIGTSIKEGLLQIDNAFVVTEEMQKMDVKSRIKLLTENKDNQENKSDQGVTNG